MIDEKKDKEALEEVEQPVEEATEEVTEEVAEEPVAEETVEEPVAEVEGGEETVEEPVGAELKGLYGRIKDKYPDREFAGDEDYDGAIEEYLDDLEAKQSRYDDSNAKLLELFESEPIASDVLRDLIDGDDFVTAVSKHIAPEDLESVEGEPNFEKREANKKMREERRAKLAEFEGSFETNKEASREALKSFQEEKGMSEEELDAFLEQVDSIFDKVQNGIITPEFLNAMYSSVNIESELADAQEVGRIAGRNETIEAKKAELEEGVAGDGMPVVEGDGGELEDEPEVEKTHLDSILERERKRDVWKQ